MKMKIQSHAADTFMAAAYLWVLLLVAVMLHVGGASAEPVAKVISISDPSQLFATKADGKIKVLNQSSQIDKGDLLETQDKTYAKIRFLDGEEITMAPNTKFKVDDYSFDKDKPKDDRSLFTLVKGTLRSLTGQLGHRNKDSYQLNTPAATIGIRGTTYLARYIPKEDATPADKRPKGKNGKENECDKYHSALTSKVIDGVIYLANDGGTQTYEKGQNGCALSNDKAPMILTESDIDFNPTFDKTLQCKL